MFRLISALLSVGLIILTACSPMVSQDQEPRELPLLASWSGDYPLAGLSSLPPGQQQVGIGYFGDQASFATVWQVFMPGEELPEIDFSKDIVVFSRNLAFYNRTNIFRVTLTAGVAEVLAMETMSAMPIEEKVAMAMAVIPRTGITQIKTDATTTISID